MTESIQKKLLRVRPPRVRITYDVETGGAMEKKELPFIVGIMADLSGNRADPDNFPILKERRMVDIDRDNFNDVMKTIGPRADLAPALKELDALRRSSDPADKALTFSNLDDFEPMRVINAMPTLRGQYDSRAQIRALQAKAESDDRLAMMLDRWVEDSDPAALDQRQKALQAAFTELDDDARNTTRQALIELDQALSASPDLPTDATLKALEKWSFVADGSDASKKRALGNARLLTGMASASDTSEHRKKAKELIAQLAADTPADMAALDEEGKKAEAARSEAVTKLGFADADAARTAAKPINDALAAGGTGTDAVIASALLYLGGVLADSASSVDAAQYPDARELADARTLAEARKATLSFASTLQAHSADSGPALVDEVYPVLGALANPDDAVGASKALLALKSFANEVVDGLQKETKTLVIAVKKGVIAVIDEQVAVIDQKLSAALSSIMHCDNFKAMEQTWRGLAYLVMRTETSAMLKLRIFNATKEELRKDMEKAVEFDQSVLFKLVYEAEYGTYGGFPYSMLVGGYDISGSNDDISFLKKIAEVAASAHAPFISSASPELFGLSGFERLDRPRDLKKVFESAEMTAWREFREMEDARYVSLVLPRVLLRLPYGRPDKRNTIPCEGLNFEEHVGDVDAFPSVGANGEFVSHPIPANSNFLWGNAAYVLAERITNAFAIYNWTAAIRGVEGGGLVEGLPLYTYTSDAGTTEMLCPIEVSITDRREKELNDLGFIALCHCKGAGKAAFFGGQTTNSPKKYFSDEANANARISAMLPYMLAASRFAHYIKVIMREKIGSFLTRGNVESYLNGWIANYVLLDDNATQDVKAAYPLRQANVVVTEVPGEPGVYKATVFLKPHFQLEELTTSIRLVANLPK